MELALPTPVFRPPSLEWRRALCGVQPISIAFSPRWWAAPWSPWLPGYAIQGKEGVIHVLGGLAPSSQTVGSNKTVIHEQAKRSS
jgi:hypothetical protein